MVQSVPDLYVSALNVDTAAPQCPEPAQQAISVLLDVAVLLTAISYLMSAFCIIIQTLLAIQRWIQDSSFESRTLKCSK